MARRKRKRREGPMGGNGKGASCYYCERTLQATTSGTRLAATRDHVYPKYRGGEYRVWCCWQCNQLKGGMLPKEWFAFMRDNPGWWTRPEFDVQPGRGGSTWNDWHRKYVRAVMERRAKASGIEVMEVWDGEIRKRRASCCS